MVGFASLQCGHGRSLNSTTITGALAGPRAGPFALLRNCRRASSNGCFPKGMIAPTTACLPSELTKNFWPPWPWGPLMRTFTSANPGTGLGLMLVIFHVNCGTYPNVCCIKPFTSSSEGRLVAVASDFAGSAAAFFADGERFCCPTSGEDVRLNETRVTNSL